MWPRAALYNLAGRELETHGLKCFKYLGSLLTNDGRCTREIKSRIAMAKAAFIKKKTLFTSKLHLNLRKKLIKCYIWSMALYGSETWKLREANQKYLEVMKLLRVNEQRNILHEIRKRKANWIGHILRRNCLLKQVIEGKIKGEWQEDEEEDVRSCWMTLRTGEYILI